MAEQGNLLRRQNIFMHPSKNRWVAKRKKIDKKAQKKQKQNICYGYVDTMGVRSQGVVPPPWIFILVQIL